MSDSTVIAEEKEIEEELEDPEGEITPIEPDELDDTDFGGDDLGDDEDADDEDEDDEVVDEDGGDGVWSSI